MFHHPPPPPPQPTAHIRDPSGQIHTVRNLRLILDEMNQQPLASILMRKMLQESVNRCQPSLVNGSRGNVITVGSYDLQIAGKYNLIINNCCVFIFTREGCDLQRQKSS